jgi:hypothetical protein
MLSVVDYEKVDAGLLNIIMALQSIELQVANKPDIPQAREMIEQLDRYRNEVALEIERQGKRS